MFHGLKCLDYLGDTKLTLKSGIGLLMPGLQGFMNIFKKHRIEAPESLLDPVTAAREGYNAFGIEYIKNYQNDVEKIKPLLDEFVRSIPRGSKLIDIGCGGGNYVKYFLEKGIDSIGVDISEVMLSEASKYVSKERLFLMDMHSLDFHEKSFDVVFSITALQYTRKNLFPKVLSEIFRIMKPDGKFFVVMLEGNHEGEEQEEYNGIVKTTYSSYYREEELRKIMFKAGLYIDRAFRKRLLLDSGKEIYLIGHKKG